MSEPLRVLLLEDVPDDARLITRELHRNLPDCEIHLVDRRDEFVTALAGIRPQLVLSDHRLAGFSGMDALRIVRAEAPDTPFIFVTGSLDEETAVACIKAGAWDYVLKDRLVRLGPAVSAALELMRTRTALKRSQEQLLHTQRMEALGQLAGGVAHDYNNLTTVILGYCDLLGDRFDAADPGAEDLAEIRLAAQRGAELSRQLLAFSRKQVIERESLPLNEVIGGMHGMLLRLLSAEIELVTSLAPRLGWVSANRGQLEQVVFNLVINARDAMPRGGILTIETAPVFIDYAYCATHADAHPGPHVMLAVHDTGTGIDEQTAARIFEPFFTTKPRGAGTGLGLATVYGIVRQADGHLTVDSTPGVGSAFRIYLPESGEPAEPLERPVAVSAADTATGTILLVEDDPAVRLMTRRVLERHGYHVITAANGAEALALDEAAKDTIHLLLTDVVMPELRGPDLAARLAKRRPGLRVLLMSGYIGDASLRPGDFAPGATFLEKPFTSEALLRAVQRALG